MSNLLATTHFISQQSRKPNDLKVVGSKKTSGLNRITKIVWDHLYLGEENL